MITAFAAAIVTLLWGPKTLARYKYAEPRVCSEHDVRVEHGQQRLEVTAAPGGRQYSYERIV